MRFADQHYCTIGGIFCLLEAKATGNSPAQQVVSFCADTTKKPSHCVMVFFVIDVVGFDETQLYKFLKGKVKPTGTDPTKARRLSLVNRLPIYQRGSVPNVCSY